MRHIENFSEIEKFQILIFKSERSYNWQLKNTTAPPSGQTIKTLASNVIARAFLFCKKNVSAGHSWDGGRSAGTQPNSKKPKRHLNNQRSLSTQVFRNDCNYLSINILNLFRVFFFKYLSSCQQHAAHASEATHALLHNEFGCTIFHSIINF